ncbi:MAG: class F sortase [Actinomycetota bacterium]|nr:class F sortase [Actinomycetota bacterium]
MAAVTLMVAGTALLTLGMRGHGDALPAPAPAPTSHRQPSTPATTQKPKPTGIAQLSAARSVPVFLHIPAIDVEVSLSALGLNPDGTAQVPTDFAQPGWYRFGPTPGQVGSAVILGHVDSYRGTAVFFELRTLQAGDSIEVTLADGVVVHFAVTSVAMYTKAQFPAEQVYASHGYAALQLVTCGGQFDRATGHYLSNVVVYSTLVAVTPATAPAPAVSQGS